MLRVTLIPRGLINHSGDVKLWWIQRKRLGICGGLVENQRPTQAVFRIWRCLRTIYIYSYKYVLSNKPCLHLQLQKHNRSYWKVKTVIILVIFLGVGAFEQLFGLVRGEFEQKFSKHSNARGGCPGGGCWSFSLTDTLHMVRMWIMVSLVLICCRPTWDIAAGTAWDNAAVCVNIYHRASCTVLVTTFSLNTV